MLADLKGKIAIVTGAGRGIGRDISLGLAREGCKVALVSRTRKQLEQVRNEISRDGGDAIALAADLQSAKDIDMIIRKVMKAFKKIDFLVNNAAILFNGEFLNFSEEAWDDTMSVNLKAVFLLSQKALKLMIAQKSGYIINISSTAALEVPPAIAAYGISKLGVAGLTQVLYEEGKKYGVKVSIIYPGMTDTKMLRDLNPPVDPGKWMLPEDITDCVLFLLKQSPRVIIKEIIPWAARHDKI